MPAQAQEAFSASTNRLLEPASDGKKYVPQALLPVSALASKRGVETGQGVQTATARVQIPFKAWRPARRRCRVEKHTLSDSATSS